MRLQVWLQRRWDQLHACASSCRPLSRALCPHSDDSCRASAAIHEPPRLILSPVIASMACPAVTTPTTSSGFATWQQTFVTQTATGTCMPNYGGYVTRYCAPGGLWEIPSSSCIRAYYYSTWRRVVCFAGAVDGIVIVAIHVLIWRRHSLRPSSLLFPSSPHIYDGCAARH